MNTYAIIDNRTSRVWCIVEAENPEFAVYRADAEHGVKYHRYERVPILAKGEDGYQVYVARHGLPSSLVQLNNENILQYFKFAECFRALPEN